MAILSHKINLRWGIVILAVIWLGTRAVHSQQLTISTFSTEDGIGAAQVWGVMQDSRGYMWFATSGGISRYDGVSFFNSTAGDPRLGALSRTIVEGENGNLWFGSTCGVIRYDGTAYSTRTCDEGLGQGTVWASTIDRFGHLWFGTDEGGLSVLIDGRFQTFTTVDGLAEDYVYSLHSDSADRLWIGTRHNGVTVCEVDASGHISDCRTFTAGDGLPHPTVRAITEDQSGVLYFGTRGGGVARFDGQGFTVFSSDQGLADDDVYSLLVNTSGELVVGTFGAGVTICTLPGFSNCRTIDTSNGLRGKACTWLFEDRERNLWVTHVNGVSMVASERFENFSKEEGLPNRRVQAIHCDNDDVTWIGTFTGLAKLTCAEGGRRPCSVQTFTTASGLPSNEIWDVLRDSRGILWVGTSAGLCRHDEQNGVFVTQSTPRGRYILDLFEDDKTRLWVGTNSGLFRLEWPDPKKDDFFPNYGTRDELDGSNVFAITEDHDGRIWAGTNGQGITVFDGLRSEIFTIESGLPSNVVRSLYTSSDGTVWIGTSGGRITRVIPVTSQQLSFEIWGMEHDITVANAAAFIEDTEGMLWVGSPNGVYQINPGSDAERPHVIRHFDRETVPGTELRNCAGIGRGIDGENGKGNSASENRRPLNTEIGARHLSFV